LGKKQYCGGCGSDSDRAESETEKSMIGKQAVPWRVALTATGQRVRQENRTVGKEQYCGTRGSDSRRTESQTKLNVRKKKVKIRSKDTVLTQYPQETGSFRIYKHV
jgi:hypothetical protein